ncbi:MAG: ATP-binding protein [Deltaproteobacteria bacterium]|nr:ATP-binding protein [Deltaproteobacteria bacterium]
MGKSTLVRSLDPDRIINLADESTFLSYSKDPARLRREIEALVKPSLIVVDELQRLPALTNTIQALLDEKSPHRFILTGSSARKLKRGGANLLPGRILLEHLDPLSIWELGDLFDLERVLHFGSLPEVYLNHEEGPAILSSYTTVYLREEIQAEAIAKNIGTYARFLDLAAEVSGQWVNYSKMASDSEIPKETIRRFFTILEDTLIAFRIPPFRPKKSERRVSQRDRFIFFDIGVRNAVLGIYANPLSPIEKGHLFEQWVILQCLYFIRAQQKEWRLSSYRTDAGAEVDIVLDVGKKLIAIEIKSGKNASEAQMKGLQSFEKIAHKPVEKYLVYQGETRQRFSRGEIAIPYREFFFDLLPTL